MHDFHATFACRSIKKYNWIHSDLADSHAGYQHHSKKMGSLLSGSSEGIMPHVCTTVRFKASGQLRSQASVEIEGSYA